MQNANPRHSIEVHNIILLNNDENLKDIYSADALGASNDSVSDCCSQQSPCGVNMPKDDFLACDDFESQCLDVCLQSADSGNREEITIPPPPQAELLPMKCRLCSRELKSDEPLVHLKESTHLKEFVERVMKDQVRFVKNLLPL